MTYPFEVQPGRVSERGSGSICADFERGTAYWENATPLTDCQISTNRAGLERVADIDPQRCREHVGENFSREAMVEAYLELYESQS